MKRTWPIIAVDDVPKSSAWYTGLLDAKNNHAGGTVFDQILDHDGTILLCLRYWEPSGRNGDHHWPPLSSRKNGRPEDGLLL